MTQFKDALEKKIQNSLYNNYGVENFDEDRYGKYKKEKKKSIKNQLKYNIQKTINYRTKDKARIEIGRISQYETQLAFIWQNLDIESKNLFIDLIAFRLLGYSKIKLPLNSISYKDNLIKVQALKINKDTIDPHFMHFMLERYDLRPLGFDVELYFTDGGIVIDFIIEQYAYKKDDKYILQAEKGDVVLDLGACWGDTALYFANKVGDTGRVFSFEFIPNNIKIWNTNIELNPQLKNRIELIEHPVSDVSDEAIYYRDNGPGSHISLTPFENQTGTTTTLSIDDFIERYNISKVDFIKMDIEGAEPAALRGALKTIKKYRPKLAIAIYHSMEDFINIPKWLMELNLGYEFYLGHFTIHSEETVIYALPTNK